MEKLSLCRLGSSTTSTESPVLDFAYELMERDTSAASKGHNESMTARQGDHYATDWVTVN